MEAHDCCQHSLPADSRGFHGEKLLSVIEPGDDVACLSWALYLATSRGFSIVHSKGKESSFCWRKSRWTLKETSAKPAERRSLRRFDVPHTLNGFRVECRNRQRSLQQHRCDNIVYRNSSLFLIRALVAEPNSRPRQSGGQRI